jgi:transcriptional regulator with XRE-family HTH domain
MVFGNYDAFSFGGSSDLTKAMAELVRNARLEAGLSQNELATKMMARQAKISDIENGKIELSASDLLHLSKYLEKPILFFFPAWAVEKINSEGIPSELQVLILNARKLSKEDIHRINIQVKALANSPSK